MTQDEIQAKGSPEMKHVGWACRTCGKTDWVGGEARAKPEHIPYRGADIGECPGTMVKLYANEEEWAANEEVDPSQSPDA